MSIVHRTTLTPTKLELLTTWLPTRPWYQGPSGAPELTKPGGFRLDDPEGEVGIEFLVAGDGPTAYLVPMTYRGAPLEGAEHALIGTTEHGVLGRRWIYDGVNDPVLAAQLAALFEGRTQPQDQSVSDTPNHDVTFSYGGGEALPVSFTVTDSEEGTLLSAPGAAILVHRVLRAGTPDAGLGHVTAPWTGPDGARVEGAFFSVVEK